MFYEYGSRRKKQLAAGITNNTGTTVLSEQNPSISLTATGGVTYLWSGGSSPNTASNTITEPGTYTVVVSAYNGVPATASIVITQEAVTPPEPEEFDYYIDPTNSAGGRNGTIANPYNSFSEAGGLVDNKSYGVKAGTEISLSGEFSFASRTNTTVGVYGTTQQDNYFKLKATSGGTCAVRFAGSTNCTLMGFDLYSDLSISLITLIQGGSGTGFSGGSGNIIANGKVHGSKQGTSDGGMGLRVGGSNWQIVGVEIYDTGSDGIYVQDGTGFLFSNLNIHHVNQNYAGSTVGFNSMGSSASGDGIQLNGNFNNFHVKDCIFDRTDDYTGNKFNFITNSSTTGSHLYTGIIEGCTFKSRSTLNANVYIERGNAIQIRYNTFEGSSGTASIRFTGSGTNNNRCHHNIFKNCNAGIDVVRVSNQGGFTGAPSGIVIDNNVFYNVSGNHVRTRENNVVARNNIHAATGTAYVINVDGTFTLSNNAYSSSARYGSMGAGANAVTGDIKFIDATNGNFHLASDSPCRNAGYDVGLTEDYDGVAIPQETNPAIGAFEYIQ